MKKKILGIIAATGLVIGLSGCNYQMVDTTFNFDRAIIDLRNGEVIEVNIKSWKDYEDGEQIQITAEDGTTYLTSSFNCTLIKD